MRLPELHTAFAELISIPSVSSVDPALNMSNRPVVELLATWFAGLGFTVDISEVPGQPDKVNLIARIGPDEGDRGLVLSGHTDTVPFNSELWQTDPFQLNERDNRWYGLGSCDMKGFFALILEALRAIDLKTLQQPLTILATADEESGMDGAKALVSKLGADPDQALGRFAVIGEPTNLRPVRMHKGIFMERIKLQGQSGHSSNPALGVNALEGMHKVIAALLQEREQLQAKFQNPGFSVPVPTMNLGHICGGDNPNRICGACELSFDFRLLPGMELAEIRSQLREIATAAVADSQLGISFECLFDGVGAIETPANAALVQYAETLSNNPAESVAYCTEAPYLQQLGLETVVMGPGSIDQAHQPNEFMDMAQIRPAVEQLRRLITDCCIEPVL